PTVNGFSGGAAASGQNTITGNLLNSTNEERTATYNVTPTSPGGCSGAQFSVTVTLLPIARITNMTAVICSENTFTVTPTTGVGSNLIPAGTSFTWGAPVSNGFLTWSAAPLSATSVFGTISSTSNTIQTATYQVNSTLLNGCTNSANFSVTVTVNPRPYINAMTAVSCEGVTFTITPAVGQPGVNGIVPLNTFYSWSAPNVTGTMTGGAPGSGTGSITGNLSNPTSTQQTAVYTVTPTAPAPGSCQGAPFTITVTINPNAAITTLMTTVCNGLTFRITPTDGTDGQVPTGTSGTTTYTWSAPLSTGITGTAGQSGVPNIFGTLTNTTNIVRSITYFVTPTTTYPLGGSACTGAVFSVVVTVNPSAVINSMTAVACTGTPFSASPTNGINGIVPAGTLYSWSAPTTPNTLSGYAGGSNLTIITGNLLNSTNAPVTATYSVTPTSPLCGNNAAFSVVVTIAPTPFVEITSTVVCGLQPFVFTPTNGVGSNIVPVGTTYAWSSVGGNDFDVLNGASQVTPGALNIFGTLRNTTNQPTTATYFVTPRFTYTSPTTGFCNGIPFTLTVNLNPTAQIHPFTTIICSGSTFVYSPTNDTNGIVPNGTTYDWGLPVTNTTFTGVATGSGAASFSGTLTSPVNIQRTATYTITPRSGNCTGTPFTAVITVNPRAVINAMTAVTCSGTPFAVTPTDVINGIVPANTTYAWSALPTVTGGITGGQTRTNQSNLNGLLDNPENVVNTATYIITPTSPQCGPNNPFTLTVTVNPTASINNFTRVVCNGSPFTVSPTTADGRLPDNTTYSWVVAVTNSAITGLTNANNQNFITGTPTNITNQIQTATYTVTPRSPLGSCNGAVFTITVTVQPSAVINSMTAVACSGSPFMATPTTGSNGIVPFGTVYRWSEPASVPGISGGLASGLSATNISGTLTNATNASITVTYLITPTSPLCGDDAIFSLVATIAPVPAISSTTISTCALVTFATTPTNGSYNGTVGNIVPSTTLYSWTASGANILGLTSVNNSSNISGTLTNQVNTPLTATYFVTPSASYSSPIAGSCPGSPFTLTVSLNPAAQITPLSQTICTGSFFEISPVNNNSNIIVPANTTYSWSAPSVPIGVIAVTSGLTGANAVAISGTLSHTNFNILSAIYSITPRSALGNCQGTTLTVTVFVNPRAVVNNVSLSVCSGVVFTFTPSNGGGNIIPSNIQYRWTSLPSFTGTVTGGATATARTNITGQLFNQTNAVQTVTYLVTPSTPGICGDGNPFTVTVTLHPTPVISAITTVVCHGLGFTISPTSANGIVPNGTTYSWPIPIAPVVTGAGAGTNLTFISATALSNPTNSQQSVTYTITPRAPVTGCQGTPFALTVTVNPNARINTFTVTTCSGILFQVSPVNNVAGNIVPIGTNYTWTLPTTTGTISGGQSANVAQPFFSATLINGTNDVQTATYTVTPIAPLCGNSNSFTIVVSVERGISIPTMFTTVCSGVFFRLTPTSPENGFILENTSYTWSEPTGNGFSGGEASSFSSTNISGTLTNLTNGLVTAVYSVTASSSNCGPLGMFSVVVTLRPIATINPLSVTTCSGIAFQVSPANGVNGNIVPMSTTYSWGLPSVSPGLTGGASGTNLTFISGTLTNTTNSVRTAVYLVTPATINCGANNPFTVTVTVDPGTIISNMTAVVCTGFGFTVTPTNGVNGIIPEGTTFTWGPPIVTGGMTGGQSGTDAVNITNAALTHSASSTQFATYIITPNTDVCSVANPFVLTVTVNPQANITPMTAVACGLLTFTVTPTDVLNGGVPVGTMYTWAAPTGSGFSGGASQTNAQNNITGRLTNTTAFVTSAVYTVSTVAGACASTFTLTVTLNPAAQPSNFSTTTCTGTPFNVTATAGIVPANTSYSWGIPQMSSGITLGVAGSGNSISGTLTNSTNLTRTAVYSVNTITGSCVGTSFSLTVHVDPRPSINSFVANPVCSGAPFAITPTSGTIIPTGTRYVWNSAPVVTNNAITNGQTQVSPGSLNIYGALSNTTSIQQTATYTITPSFAACTGSSFVFTITINPTPVVSNLTRVICSGEPVTITPVEGTHGSIIPLNTLYAWNSGTVTPNNSVIGNNSSGYVSAFSTTLSLISADITTRNVRFAVTPRSTIGSLNCSGNPFSITITVNPRAIITAMSTFACSGEPFVLTPTNSTNGTVPANTTYTWEMPSYGAGVSGGSSQTNPSSNIFGTLTVDGNSTQTAVYTVIPNTTNCGVGSPFTVSILVRPSIIIRSFSLASCSGAPFAYTPTNGQNGNLIPDGVTYTWDPPTGSGFTGGFSSSVGSDAIVGTLFATSSFIATATYVVTPSISACSASGSFTVMVNVTPIPNINPMSRTTCGGVSFNAVPLNNTDGLVPTGTLYTWNAPSVTTASLSGGQTRSTQENSIFGTLTNQTNTPQTAVYTVTSYLNACQGNVFTLTVNVNPRPILQNVVTTVCTDATFTVSPTTTAVNNIAPLGTTYSWGVPTVSNLSLTGGQSANGQSFISGTLTNPTNVVLTAAYMVTPIGPAEYGACLGNPFTITVNVNPRPVVAGIFRTVCSGVTFVVSPTNGSGNVVPLNTTYTWTAVPVVSNTSLTGGGVGANVSFVTGTLFNGTPGAQTATYTVTPSFSGCTGPAFQVTITVNPAATIAGMSTTTCSGIQFTVTPSASLPGNIIPANTTYTWLEPTYQNPALSGGVSISTPQNDVFGTLNNSSNITYYATYTVRPTTGLCLGNTFQVLAYIQPKPQVNEMSIVSCAGVIPVVPTNIINGTSIPTNAVYTWGIPTYSSSSLTGGNSGSQTGGITQNLINTSSVTQTATYTVTPSFGTCGNSNPFTLTFFVNPVPSITSMARNFCSGIAFSVTPTNGTNGFVPDGTTYTWDAPSMQNPALTGGQTASTARPDITGQLFNSSNITYSATYIVRPRSQVGNCPGNNFNLVVSVFPQPSINQMSTTTCSGVPFVAVPTQGVNGTNVPANLSYSWERISTSSASLTGAPSGSGTGTISGTLTNSSLVQQSATYSVIASNGVCSSTTFTLVVHVNPTPFVNQIVDAICTGLTFTVVPSNSVGGNLIPLSTTYSWGIPAYENTTPGVMVGGAASVLSPTSISGNIVNNSNVRYYALYRVTPSTSLCQGSQFSVFVNIDPKPIVYAMSTTICNGAFVFTPTHNSNGQVVPVNTVFTWGVPLTSTTQLTGGVAGSQLNTITGSLNNASNVTQTAVYSVVPSFGTCTGSSFTATVFVNPRPVITTMTTVICTATSFSLTPENGRNGFVPGGTTYQWNEPTYSNNALDGGETVSSGQNSIYGTLTNSGSSPYTATYNVVASTLNCGGVTFSVIVTVDPKPQVSAMSTVRCSGVGFVVSPVDGTNGLVPSNTRYAWEVPAGS
ncbi:MAG: hypothetical protein IM540_03225, partial [Chitinophagaceae bacterium]|nr:hypothetical protein [Chitinophagaceae bacterium]